MSIDTCIDTAIAGKELTKAEGERLKRDYERFRRQKATGAGGTAEAEAKRLTIEMLQAESAQKRRQLKKQVAIVKRLDGEAVNFRDAAGKRDIAEYFRAKMEHFGEETSESVEGLRKAILGQAHAKMANILMHFERGALKGDLGRRNAADMPNVVRELFGNDTGDTGAKALAKSWKDTSEWLRQRFNAAGGAIGRLENWGLPQHHDRLLLSRAGKTAWIAYIKPRLDAARMTHPLTGAAVTAGELDDLLADIHDRILTDGWIDREASGAMFGRGKIANQHAEHRFLVFRDADAWMEYQAEFGGGDAFAAMVGHVAMLSRDIAAMEVLGPNPSATVNWMKQRTLQEAAHRAAGRKSLFKAKPARAMEDATAANARLDAIWETVRGAANTPVDSRWADTFRAGRNLMTATRLGGALLSSASDIGTSMLARKFAGITGDPAMASVVKAFSQMSRQEAVEAGLGLDSAMHVFADQARYVGTFRSMADTGYIADRVIAWSGLSAWTQAARHAFGLDFMATAARHAGTAFADLPDAFRATLSRHGITAENWRQMSAAKIHQTAEGGRLLRAREVDHVHPDLASRYLSMILMETEYAVPTGTLRGRSFLVPGRAGTFGGELGRSFLQFRSFPATFAMLHGMRIGRMVLAGNRAGAAGYAAALALSSLVFGAISVQLKDIAAGREPRPMGTPQFAAAAFMQGGGLGLFGDFVFSDVNRYGGSFLGSAAGPVGETTGNFLDLTIGNLIQLGMGEKRISAASW